MIVAVAGDTTSLPLCTCTLLLDGTNFFKILNTVNANGAGLAKRKYKIKDDVGMVGTSQYVQAFPIDLLGACNPTFPISFSEALKIDF